MTRVIVDGAQLNWAAPVQLPAVGYVVATQSQFKIGVTAGAHTVKVQIQNWQATCIGVSVVGIANVGVTPVDTSLVVMVFPRQQAIRHQSVQAAASLTQ